MDLDSVYRSCIGNDSIKKSSSITPIEILNDRETKRQQKEVNYSILKDLMYKWTNVVDDQVVEDTKANKQVEIAKPGQLKSWLTHNEYYKEGSIGAGIMNIIKDDKNKIPEQVNPDDKHLNTVEQLQKERSNRRHHEQMMSKSRMTHKIKSKNFHRHQKKRTIKDFLRNEETIMREKHDHLKNNLEAFEKLRAEERISLKHRVGGKFAKIQKLRAKYDPNAREALSNMHDKGKELTTKHVIQSDEDSDEEDEDVEDIGDDTDQSGDTEEDEVEEGSADEEMMAGTQDNFERTDKLKASQFIHVNQSKCQAVTAPVKANIITTIQPQLPDHGESSFTDNMCEIFQSEEIYQYDEQLAEQFAKEKAELVKNENPKDIQTFVPGWGSWTGPGLEAADKLKLKRGLVKAPDTNRKDKQKSHVWIKEGVSDETKKHLINAIPFPYNTAEQFNLSRQQLVSSAFNLQTVTRQLIKPKFNKKAGQMIYPRVKEF